MYNAPQQMGPANLLFAEPTGYKATMVCFPYDDLASWRGPYPPTVFAEQFEKVADGWAEGLRQFETAVTATTDKQRATADSRSLILVRYGFEFTMEGALRQRGAVDIGLPDSLTVTFETPEGLVIEQFTGGREKPR